MRGNLWKLLLVTTLFVLAMAGCSVEPGGSEDPPGFSAELTPAEVEDVANVAATKAEAEAPNQLETLEGSLQAALVRIDVLEQSVKALKDSVGAIEITASQALLKAQEGPLARVDLSNDTAVGKALMEQSLEQIIGISKLLLDKMEDQVRENGSSETVPPTPEGPTVEVQ